MNDPYQGYAPHNGNYPPQGYPAQGYPHQGYPPQGYPPQGQPPNVGFVNPSYPQPTGFVPLVPPSNAPFGHVPNIPPQHPGAFIDPEDLSDVKGFEFSDQTIRRGFIRKVYSILSIQLLITLAFIFLVGYEENTNLFVSNNLFMLILALIVVFASLIAMVCCEGVRRTAPTNFIMLGIFTVAETYLIGASTIRYDREDVLLAVGITTLVCVGLTLFAFQTKWDFTMMGGILCVALIILIFVGIIGIFVPGRTMTLIYSSFGAILFSMYLIYDTQMMMGGKHKYSISPEEYVFGALTLYLDIINIFIHILSIIGASKN